jgi:hypothetical protein
LKIGAYYSPGTTQLSQARPAGQVICLVLRVS